MLFRSWREIHKLEQEKEDTEVKIAKEEEQERLLYSEEERRWRVSPVELLIMLLVLVISFLIFGRPWNYLLVIVLALAEGMYVWNRLKDGKKKPQEIAAQERRTALEKLLWQRERMESELKEKQVIYGNLQEELEELDEADAEYKSLNQKKQEIGRAHV